jgi:uncharacterized membrane protein
MTSVLVLAVVALFIQLHSLRQRVRLLEQQEKVQRTSHVEGHTLTPLPRPNTETLVTGSAATPLPDQSVHFIPVSAQIKAETAATSWFLYRWFKTHTLIKVGGLFFFLGAGWFVSYAIREGWLSPEIRILFGVLFALGAYLIGWYRNRHDVVEYGILTGLGTAILLVSFLVGHSMFALFSLPMTLCVVLIALGYSVWVSLKTRLVWLTFLAAVAGLAAPQFVDFHSSPFMLLCYLTALLLGLLWVGTYRQWRLLTLVLLVGVLWYEATLLATAPEGMLWAFVISTALLFFVSVTILLIRSRTPESTDIATLIILSTGYVLFASELAQSASAALFLATFLSGAVGFHLWQTKFPAPVVAVYLTLTGAGILIGTSFLLSGYTLTLAFMLELLAAFLLATYLVLPERVTWTIVGLYALPVFGSFASLGSSDWGSSIFHPDAFVVYTVLAALVGSTAWLVHKPGVAIYSSSRMLVATLAVSAFVYAYAVIAVVTEAVFLPVDWFVFMYILWALLSLAVLYYAHKRHLPLSVVRAAAASLTIPVLSSLQSFFSPVWQSGIYHTQSFGVFGITGILLLTTLLLVQEYRRDYEVGLRSLIGKYILGTTLYIALWLILLTDNLLEASVAEVALYLSYAFLIYVLVAIFTLVRAPSAWIQVSLISFSIPLLLSLSSFTMSGWSSGPLSPEAVGLATSVCVFVLVGLGVRERMIDVPEYASTLKPKATSQIFFTLAALYSVGLVWGLTHSVVAQTEAVSVALFIYTLVGLGSYLFGTRTHNREFWYLGVALLVIVVARLLLVDIWNMEIVWRFITLLGIGSLFIGAAFFEKKERQE